MVRPKLLRHFVALAKAVQQIGVALDLAPGVWEHKVVGTSQRLVHVRRDESGRGRLGRLFLTTLPHNQRLLVSLYEDLELTSRRGGNDHADANSMSRPKKFSCKAHVTQGGREAHSRYFAAQNILDAVHQGLKLLPPLRPDKRMQLIDHKKCGHLKHRRDGRPSIAQQCLEGLWSDEQDSVPLLQELGLGRRTNIAMPRPHGDIQLLAELVEPTKLVVDEGFERTDVDDEPRLIALQ
ncbi:hypothetical protein D3C71_958590 [compost metagenome]